MGNELHHIVVVGGGAGGIELVTRLGKHLGRKGLANITLLDKQDTHIWKPLLHEVAAGSLDSNMDQLNFYSHSVSHYYNYQPGTMIGLDRKTKVIRIAALMDEEQNIIVPERTLKYDTLVIAVGSQSNDFNTPGVKEYCLSIDSIDQANHFQKKYVDKLLSLQYAPGEAHQDFNIVIIGGGATGIELGSELLHTLNQTEKYQFNHRVRKLAKITVIEGAPRILPVLPELLSTLTAKKLHELGIEILTNEIVSHIDNEGIHTKSGKILPASICVWAAGVKAPEFLATLDGLAVDNLNRIVINSKLQTMNDESIFAIGDCAQVIDVATGKPVPPRAQAAHQQAYLLAKSLKNKLNNKELLDFKYEDRGSLIALSCYGAYGDISGIGKARYFLGGKVAQLAYRSLYLMHLSVLYGIWCSFLLRIANKMLSRTRPKLKLHISKH
ncbi:respiratory NADH dehydrogenase 2/cupric reductase [Legionella gratiana]|uniref:Respiratory NADH dehydrogenase 2/cupric reductase n=1 Tax=Legionella gratiana TaxID=45066 RepID=A0A378JLE8_9GAMM|nr:NAD(P)/FAD-dependent oxidoreductase [Legionella gratiana]KTD09197.1 respiratory NADH dehydrogenase 2/cupric reductase [Legionella gratiana]STX45550.1 respiratory NADH dehydrogenase 2/cupric reductase [Legionella gratiana]